MAPCHSVLICPLSMAPQPMEVCKETAFCKVSVWGECLEGGGSLYGAAIQSCRLCAIACQKFAGIFFNAVSRLSNAPFCALAAVGL
jgi:hypothetical protein